MTDKTKHKRGEDLPQSKLTEMDVLLIREAARYREKLRKEASELKSANLAIKFEVHQRTIEKVISYASWKHVADKL